MTATGGDLLDEAIGGGGVGGGGRVVVVEDCVEASGAFLLHLLLKRSLLPATGDVGGGEVVFLGLAQPFAHYDRVLRKMGCNLSIQRKNNRLHFFELLEFSGKIRDANDRGFVQLYRDIERVAMEASSRSKEYNTGGAITIMIDDLSLLEIAAHGSVDDILDFLHYCITLTSELDCSLLILIHEDIYSSKEDPGLRLHLHYLADVVIKAAPLSTGLAADVHGQLSIVNKEMINRDMPPRVRNFHFKVKENGVEFFYPGSRH